MHLPNPATAAATVVTALLFTSVLAIPQTHNAPAANSTVNLGGRYRVVGTNPDGGQYLGTLEVISHGNVYQFRWNAGTQYDGIGVRNGKIAAVAFASGSDGTGCGVVDYTVLNDGSLDCQSGMARLA